MAVRVMPLSGVLKTLELLKLELPVVLKNRAIPLIVLGSLPFIGSMTYAQTLQETVSLALGYQSDARMADLQILDQQSRLADAQNQTGLKLSATGELGIGYVQPEHGANFPQPGKRYPVTFGLQLSKPLYTGGREELGIEAAQAGVDAAEASREQARLQVRMMAINVQSALVRDQLILEVLQKSQTGLDRAVFDAEKRFAAGEVTKTDVAQAHARKAQGLASISRAQATLQVDRTRYAQLTGQSPRNIPTVLNAPKVPSLDTALNLAQNSPALEAARAQLTAAERSYNVSLRSFWPTVQLAGHAIHQKDSDLSRTGINSFGVSLQANLPLIDGGRDRIDQQKARVQVELAEERINGLRQTLEQKIREDYALWQSSQQQAASLLVVRTAAESALDTIAKEMELGTRTTFDLLTAQRDLVDAQTQIIVNQQEQAVRSYQILTDIGLIRR